MEASGGDAELEVGESAEAAEDEVGITNWIAPETGLPAEESVRRTGDE